MSKFIEWLEGLNAKDTKVRAVLRRSLAFDPGTFIAAFPYIEPFAGKGDYAWRRVMLYLVSGLWAAHIREGENREPLSFGRACAAHQLASGSTSTERRFIALLDADEDQLPHRLRQMVALLKDQPIDFEALLTDLTYWTDEQKRTQIKWARDFYRNLGHETQTEIQIETEPT